MSTDKREHWVTIGYPGQSGNHHYVHGVEAYTAPGGGRVKHRASVRLTDETIAYRAMVHGQLFAQGKSALKLTGPLEVEWRVNPPDARARDMDNVLKVCKDALTKGGFWLDDSNKVIRRTLFEWLDPVPGGRVVVIARPWFPMETCE